MVRTVMRSGSIADFGSDRCKAAFAQRFHVCRNLGGNALGPMGYDPLRELHNPLLSLEWRRMLENLS